MPTRYLRPGIRDSEFIDGLEPLTETLYYRLLVTVDDFGRTDARPAMVKAACFPIKKAVTEDACKEMLKALHHGRLIHLYAGPDGKPYLQVLRWSNTPRAATSNYPEPPHKGAPASANAGGAHTGADNPRTTPPVTVTGTGTETEKGGAGAPPKPKAKANPKYRAEDIELPEWLPRELWARWCVDRRKRGKSITEEGAKLQLKQLDQYRQDGHTPKAVIEHCMAGGFQGLYPPKVHTNGAAPPPGPKPWHEQGDKLIERGAELGIVWDPGIWYAKYGTHSPSNPGGWMKFREEVMAAHAAEGNKGV